MIGILLYLPTGRDEATLTSSGAIVPTVASDRPSGYGSITPHKFTPEVSAAFIQNLKEGCPRYVAYGLAKVSQQVFYYHLEHDKEFALEVAQAEADFVKVTLKTIKLASQHQWPGLPGYWNGCTRPHSPSARRWK